MSGDGFEESFTDCLWEVHIQGQYSALREYLRVLGDSENRSGKAIKPEQLRLSSYLFGFHFYSYSGEKSTRQNKAQE